MGFVSSLLICTLVALKSNAVEPTTEPSTQPDDVAQFITQLADEDWQTREAAQERLVLMGREVRDALERAARHADDPEIRSRAEAALALIAQNAETGPSIITIRGTDIPLRDVIRQLSGQAGATLEPYPPDVLEQQHDAKVSLDIDHQPFWEAMRQITEKTGFSLQQWDNSGVKLMQTGRGAEGISQVSGAYMISAVRVSRNRSIELVPGAGAGADGQDAAQPVNLYEDFNVQLTARAEPKLRLLRVGYVPNIEEAVDEYGHSLLPVNIAPSGGFTFAPAGVWQLSARLSAPPGVGNRIARLRGSLDVSVQTRYEQIEVPDITSAHSITRVAGGMRFIVKELRRNGDAWALDIVVRPESADAEQWERMQQVLSVADMKLLDERGEVYQRTGYSTSGGPQQIEMAIEFSARAWGRNRKLGDPWKLVWTVPTATKDLTIPFDFRDLPIP